MEKGIALLDFENTDQMVQIHDYEGVSLSSRDANSKNAASEATSIFTDHYPELLVSSLSTLCLLPWVADVAGADALMRYAMTVQKVLRERADVDDMDLLGVQASSLFTDDRQDERCRQWSFNYWQSTPTVYWA